MTFIILILFLVQGISSMTLTVLVVIFKEFSHKYSSVPSLLDETTTYLFLWFPQTHQQDDEFPGEPLFHRPYFGSYVRRPLQELLEPSIHLPRSRITRDPWWWDYPTLRPYSPYSRYPYTSLRYPLSPSWRSPYYLRDSYLSPIKRTYLWSYHPHRPFCEYSCLSTAYSLNPFL